MYESDTSITCASPGGWGSGNAVTVEVTFNGEDYTKANNTFYFYNIFDAFPRSGPSDGSAGSLAFLGSGFRNSSDIKCMIDKIAYKPFEVKWDRIMCRIPKSTYGDDFFGNVPLEVTVNGLDYHKMEGGFQYYPQVIVHDIFPKTGPAKGNGIINFYGEKFRDDFPLARPSCRFGEYYGVGQVINENEMKCHIPNIQVMNQTYLPYAALNNHSFVPGKHLFVFVSFTI